MTAPTFTTRRAAQLSADVTRYRLECAHGTTFRDAISGDYPLIDHDVVAAPLAKHERVEECVCVLTLVRASAPGASKWVPPVNSSAGGG